MKCQPRILAGTALGLLMASAPLAALPLPGGTAGTAEQRPPLLLAQAECQEGESARDCAVRLRTPQAEQPAAPAENAAPSGEQAAPAAPEQAPREKKRASANSRLRPGRGTARTQAEQAARPGGESRTVEEQAGRPSPAGARARRSAASGSSSRRPGRRTGPRHRPRARRPGGERRTSEEQAAGARKKRRQREQQTQTPGRGTALAAGRTRPPPGRARRAFSEVALPDAEARAAGPSLPATQSAGAGSASPEADRSRQPEGKRPRRPKTLAPTAREAARARRPARAAGRNLLPRRSGRRRPTTGPRSRRSPEKIEPGRKRRAKAGRACPERETSAGARGRKARTC